MSEKETVLAFLEQTKKLPQVLSVERTTKSKYQFYLVVRKFSQRLGIKPRCHSFENQKGFADTVKAVIEEHDILTLGGKRLIALEGFSLKWLEKISPAPGTYIIAETDGGQLKAENYSYWSHAHKRGILKLLKDLLSLDHLTLTDLVARDWSSLRDFEDYEPVLAKAKLLKWSTVQLDQELAKLERGNLLTLLKRGDFKPLYYMMRRYSHGWTYNQLLSNLTDLIHYRSLRTMGFEPEKVAKEMEIGHKKSRDLEDAATMLTPDDVNTMVQRIFMLDSMVTRQREIGTELLLLNAPIRMRR